MINKTKIEALISQLQAADKIEVVGEAENVCLEWDDMEITGNPENQLVYLTWTGDDCFDYKTILTEQGLSDAQVNNNSIFCQDYEGEPVHLRLWSVQPMNCENDLKNALDAAAILNVLLGDQQT